FHPFMPYGFGKSGPPGSEVGVMAGAAIIFFAFYGFDAIATAAEEAKNPSRDLAIGIVGSMVVCVAIYMAAAAAAIGAVAYSACACRDARGLCGGLRRDARAAPTRAAEGAQVSRSGCAAGRRGGHPRVHLSFHQPAQPHPIVLPRRADDRRAALFHLRPPGSGA